MKSTVSVGEGIRYGFGLLVYAAVIVLFGGLAILFGFALLGAGSDGPFSRGNPLLLLFGALVTLGGVVVIYAGFLGTAYKVIADAVRVGIEAADKETE